MIALNSYGNSYPSNQPVFIVVVIKDGRVYKKGQMLSVMESQNPIFKGKWRINDSEFIRKDFCKLI